MSGPGQTKWVPWDVTDGILFFFFFSEFLCCGVCSGECFLSWSTQEDAGSRPFALKCPHVRAGPEIQMYPLRQ